MGKNLDKLSRDELFILLSEKLDQESATAISHQGVSGNILVHLTDNDLKELLPKLGPRAVLQMLVREWKSDAPSKPKVIINTCSMYRHALC